MGLMPVWPRHSISISDEVSARQTVASVKDRGADFIKVYSLIPREAYFALADEAKKRGIPFAGHVPLSVSAFEASDAGQKSIEHLDGILLACSTIEPELRKTIEEAIKGAKDTDQMRASLVRALNETEFKSPGNLQPGKGCGAVCALCCEWNMASAYSRSASDGSIHE